MLKSKFFNIYDQKIMLSVITISIPQCCARLFKKWILNTAIKLISIQSLFQHIA